MNSVVLRSVQELLDKDNSGHGIDHIMRVHKLAMKFADTEEANKNIIELAALLHDADDYKIFGEASARDLTNSKQILDDAGVDDETKQAVIEIVKNMGYNKYLEGIRPATIEGMIVSDADMCDSLGAQGILRTYAYNSSKGNPFFDKALNPNGANLGADEYRSLKTGHSVQHFFDKLLKVSSILMTDAGCKEGAKRQKIMVDFLDELFREEDATNWSEHLSKFINNQSGL